MVGNTTYGQVIYFDTEKKEFENNWLGQVHIYVQIFRNRTSRWITVDWPLGKNVGVMEIDDVATKIIWQEF